MGGAIRDKNQELVSDPTPLPPTIQQNCYTGSSECTPRDHLTHHFLEIIPKHLGNGSVTIQNPYWPREITLFPTNSSLPGCFPRSHHSGTGDFLGHTSLALVISSVTMVLPPGKWVSDHPKPLLAEGNHLDAHKFLGPGVFSPVTPFGHRWFPRSHQSGAGDFLGHHGFSPVTPVECR